MNELRLLLRDTVAGSGHVALISGEAGIGKTVLIECFTREQRGRVRVLWGTCDLLLTPRPLGPLRDIVTQGTFALDGDPFTTFTAFLRELMDNAGPTIIVIEDVHWADETTLDLLKFLG
ncbi:MAG TPA: ATP-binding protein, partial [Anaerolineae bacterium]|nr:ATP-binding protein [Anaerolineae bacterium]